MIELGLARIGRLVQNRPRTWKAIHVAGTNGKGSICAYISAMLHASGRTVGRFTSPHLVDRWDCIVVNEKPISKQLFLDTEQEVARRNRSEEIGATEFELLTAAAFDIFEREKVRHGVVEVGLGGRLDATNVLDEKAVTVISKVGLDHQSLLGDTLEEIATHKAGIMRPGVPCVVDGSNDPSVLAAIRRHAEEVGAEVIIPPVPPASIGSAGLRPHQLQNLACAYTAFRIACSPSFTEPLESLMPVIKRVTFPGRHQLLDIGELVGRDQQLAFLDGAHNMESARVLAATVQGQYRRGKEPLTWVLAFSAGKDMRGMVNLLVKPQDRVAAVRFGSVDGMPWVQSEAPASILGAARYVGVAPASQFCADGDVTGALRWASEQAGDGPLVIAGSLYLASEILRRLGRAPWTPG